MALLAACVVASACGDTDEDSGEADTAAADARADSAFAPLAEQYVRLVLGVGQHDGGYVDAYYGPAEWQQAAVAEKPSLDTLATRGARLRQQIQATDVTGASELVQLRKAYLHRQLSAVEAYLLVLQGKKLSFDDESRALYDAVAPTHDEAHFRALVDSLAAVLPGSGPVPARLEAYRRDFVIPKEKLDTVFKAAIAEARRRTAANVELPAGETFTLEYVTNKSWSGYNWYQG